MSTAGLMAFTINASNLLRLDQALSNSEKVVTDRRIAGSAMRNALKPLLEATRRNAPTGKGNQRISLKQGRRARAKNSDSNAYRRGGATRADQRIKIVKGEGVEVVRGVVGTDKRRGKVGFRTHLITRANKHRRTADDFLQRSHDQEIQSVTNAYGSELAAQVDKAIKRSL